MKKLIVVLAVLGIFQIGSFIYYNSKLLAEPIVIASEVNLYTNEVNISYITNRLNPVELQSVVIAGRQFYPRYDNPLFNNDLRAIQTYADYTYYSIVAPAIPLQIDETEEGFKELQQAKEATVYFKDGFSQQVPLNVTERIETPQLNFKMSSAGSNGTEEQFKLTESMTLHKVEVIDDKVEIYQLLLNNNEVTLPIKDPIDLQENDVLHFKTSDGLSRYFGEWFTIHLHVTDQTGQLLIIPVSNSVNSKPSEHWVEQLVKERGKW